MSKATFIMVRNKGSALIIALVFLLIMTLIGTTAMQGTSQQESMAGNMRDRSLAFQAAEAALRVAQGTIDNGTPTITTVPSSPLTDSNWINTYDWSAATQLAAGTLSGITDLNQPRYVIEDTSSQNPECGSSSVQALPFKCYRVTARGVGGTQDAVVIVQSNYYD